MIKAIGKYIVGSAVGLLFLLLLNEETAAQTVYITKTGKKYHTESCRYLHSSKISTTLNEAQRAGYQACSVCGPPTTVDLKERPLVSPLAQPKERRPSVSTQCTGITKAGSRCKRMTTSSTGRCYQH